MNRVTKEVGVDGRGWFNHKRLQTKGTKSKVGRGRKGSLLVNETVLKASDFRHNNPSYAYKIFEISYAQTD